jgi:hypothetical protein
MFKRFKEWQRSRFQRKARNLYGNHRFTSAKLDAAQARQVSTEQLHDNIHARQEARVQSAMTSFKDPRYQQMALDAEEKSKAKLEPMMEQDTKAVAELAEDRQQDYDKELKKATKHYKRNQEQYYDAAVESMQEAGLELKTKANSDKKDSDTPINPGIKVG